MPDKCLGCGGELWFPGYGLDGLKCKECGRIYERETAYTLRCAGCDECVPWATFDSEEEWQEFREAVGSDRCSSPTKTDQ